MSKDPAVVALKEKAQRLTRLRATLQWSLFIMVPLVIIGGFWYPYLGFSVPVVMMMGIVVGFTRGRWVCGWSCPRGGFWERIMGKLSLGLGMPAWMRHYALRWTLVVLLMGFMVYRLSLNPGSAEHWGRVFWFMCLVTTGLGIVLAVLFMPRSWCAVCPIGTISGASGGRKNTLQIGPGCRGCKVCEKACPLHLEIAKDAPLGELQSRDCLRCYECVKVCPVGILSFPGDKCDRCDAA